MKHLIRGAFASTNRVLTEAKMVGTSCTYQGDVRGVLGRHKADTLYRLEGPSDIGDMDDNVCKFLGGLLVGGVRPEKEGELLPQDRGGAIQGEVSQQVLETRMVDTGDRLITLAKRAEKIELQAHC